MAKAKQQPRKSQPNATRPAESALHSGLLRGLLLLATLLAYAPVSHAVGAADPSAGDAHFGAGRALAVLDRCPEAMAQFDAAVHLALDFIEARDAREFTRRRPASTSTNRAP